LNKFSTILKLFSTTTILKLIEVVLLTESTSVSIGMTTRRVGESLQYDLGTSTDAFAWRPTGGIGSPGIIGERFRGVNAPGGTRVKHMNYRRGDVVGIAVDCTEDSPFFSFFVNGQLQHREYKTDCFLEKTLYPAVCFTGDSISTGHLATKDTTYLSSNYWPL
jgi:hypothetical protein